MLAGKERTIDDVARECLSKEGDVLRATDAMERIVRKYPVLYRDLLDRYVHEKCYDKIRAIQRAARRHIWNNPQPSAAEAKDRVVALGRGLLDFPLPSGKCLGDANADEIGEASSFYSRQAKDMAAKARWLALVAAQVPAGKIARDVLDEAALLKLRERVL